MRILTNKHNFINEKIQGNLNRDSLLLQLHTQNELKEPLFIATNGRVWKLWIPLMEAARMDDLAILSQWCVSFG